MEGFLPYFRLYPAETIADERFAGWTMEERGVWLTLLLHAWVNGSIPSDVPSIARILHTDATALRPLWDAIADRFIPHPDKPGRLTSARLEKERDNALAKSEAGKKAARSRWDDAADADAKRPQSGPNAGSDARSTAQRSAAQQQPLVTEAPASADPWDRVSGEWARVCVPAGFARPRATAQQRKAAASRVREPGWFDAFVAACRYMAGEPFYRGKSSSGWVATLGWLLKPGNAEKTAERADTRGMNANGSDDPALLRALEAAERGDDGPDEAGAGTGDEGDGRGVRCSPPLGPPAHPLAAYAEALSAPLRTAVGDRGEAGKLQDAARVEPRNGHGVV